MVMPLNLVSDRSPFRTLLMITLVVMIGLVVGPLLGGTIASGFYDGDFIRDLQNLNLKPDAFNAILILQGTGTLVSLDIISDYLHHSDRTQKSAALFSCSGQPLNDIIGGRIIRSRLSHCIVANHGLEYEP